MIQALLDALSRFLNSITPTDVDYYQQSVSNPDNPVYRVCVKLPLEAAIKVCGRLEEVDHLQTQALEIIYWSSF